MTHEFQAIDPIRLVGIGLHLTHRHPTGQKWPNGGAIISTVTDPMAVFEAAESNE